MMIYTKPLDKSLLVGLKYSPQTGLIYRSRSWGNAKAGPVLTKRQGYRTIKINGLSYFQHRLCFLFMDEVMPNGVFVDHCNGIRHDNRWKNLRLVTNKENVLNQKMHRDGKEAYVRFVEDRNSWIIQKNINGKKSHFGYFKTKKEATKQRNWLDENGWPLPAHKPRYICFDKSKGKWFVRKLLNGKRKYFGYFKTEEEAVNKAKRLVASNWKI